jgi:mannose-1-phosphate guanylyltransferase
VTVRRGALDLRAVIMAGGSGTRFWPLSRKRRPKQFLPIVGSRSMLEETAERIRPLIPRTKVYTIADAAQTRVIGRLLPRIPRENLIVEPRARNTAPSLLLATARVHRKNPRAVVAVLPSDHLIADAASFLKKLQAAAAAAFRTKALVTFGIPPTFPSTGYGYIHFRREGAKAIRGEAFHRVESFREKPDAAKAAEFILSGDYFWNSGMFVWRADAFAEALKNHAPELRVFWDRILDALRAGRAGAKRLSAVFDEIPSISIDYALMEKAEDVLVTKGDFGWSDVGAWSSLAEIWDADTAGNAGKGEIAALDSQGTVCYNPGRLTALIGARDLVIVNAGDALLVCRKDQDQRVREIIEILGKMGRSDLV